MKHKILGSAVAAALSVWAASAHADLINLGDNNIQLSGTVPNMESGTIQWDGHQESGGAGMFEFNVTNPSGTPNTGGTIYTFCTDVGIYYRNDTYTAVQFAGQTGVKPKWGSDATGANALLAIQDASWLYNKVFEANSTAFMGSANTEKSVAMQFAIWASLYNINSSGIVDTSFGIGDRFQYVSGFNSENFLTDAQGYLAELNTARSSGNFTVYSDTWLKPNDNNSQGMLYNHLTPVPEPTTFFAGALLLLPFGASTLRFVRKMRVS